MTKLHTVVLVGLAAILVIALLPLGSNRPFFWAVNGVLIGGLALWYAYEAGGGSRHPRVSLRDLALPALLVGVVIVWLTAQLVPFRSGLTPEGWDAAAEALQRDIVPSLSVDPAATFGMLIRYLSYALVFVLAAQISVNASRAHRLLEIVFWIVVAEAAYGIVALLVLGDTLLLLQKWSYQGFATGSFVNRNHFATFLGFGAAIGTGLFLEGLGFGGQVSAARKTAAPGWDAFVKAAGLYGTGLVVIASCIALTGSRMGALASALGVVAVFLFTLLRARGRRRGLALWLVLAVAAGASVLAFSGQRIIDRVGSLESSSDERLLLYSQTGTMIEQRPLLGYGGGAFEDAFQAFHMLPLSADVAWDKAHNLYLELVADLGVLGLAPILLVLWLSVRILVSGLRASNALPFTSAIGVVTIAGVHSLVDFSLQIEAIVFTFLIVLAVGYAQTLAQRSSERRGSEERPRSAQVSRARVKPREIVAGERAR